MLQQDRFITALETLVCLLNLTLATDIIEVSTNFFLSNVTLVINCFIATISTLDLYYRIRATLVIVYFTVYLRNTREISLFALIVKTHPRLPALETHTHYRI